MSERVWGGKMCNYLMERWIWISRKLLALLGICHRWCSKVLPQIWKLFSTTQSPISGCLVSYNLIQEMASATEMFPLDWFQHKYTPQPVQLCQQNEIIQPESRAYVHSIYPFRVHQLLQYPTKVWVVQLGTTSFLQLPPAPAQKNRAKTTWNDTLKLSSKVRVSSKLGCWLMHLLTSWLTVDQTKPFSSQLSEPPLSHSHTLLPVLTIALGGI